MDLQSSFGVVESSAMPMNTGVDTLAQRRIMYRLSSVPGFWRYETKGLGWRSSVLGALVAFVGFWPFHQVIVHNR